MLNLCFIKKLFIKDMVLSQINLCPWPSNNICLEYSFVGAKVAPDGVKGFYNGLRTCVSNW